MQAFFQKTSKKKKSLKCLHIKHLRLFLIDCENNANTLQIGLHALLASHGIANFTVFYWVGRIS